MHLIESVNSSYRTNPSNYSCVQIMAHNFLISYQQHLLIGQTCAFSARHDKIVVKTKVSISIFFSCYVFKLICS